MPLQLLLLLAILLVPLSAFADSVTVRNPSPLKPAFNRLSPEDPSAAVVAFVFKGTPGFLYVNEHLICRNQVRCTGEIPAGEYTITLRQDGFLDSSFKIRVPNGTDYYPTRLREKPGELKLQAMDAKTGTALKASVWMDDKEIGVTPWTGAVPDDVKGISVRLPGYLEFIVKERPPRRKQITATAALTKTPTSKMKDLEAGCFEMGSEAGKKDEKPIHKVCLDGFYMDQYEVSQKQFLSVMGVNPSFFGACGEKCPVESVTWKQATAYCAKMGKRLPTEAEWEYAARAGSSSKWGCGIMSACLSGVAWYEGNSNKSIHPVGQLSSNSWDLYDMQGNVAEWTADWYGHTYYGFSPKDNPKGANGGDSRSVRGGSYEDKDKYMLPSVRGGFDPAFRETTIGFRCAMDLPKE